ncbi:Centrosomal protein of 72 kDa [Heterocephalus glaber]|uniref:Centrosomal protein of 72 kDa n=1 Tax=Heterocephalus glaber TaxID=10181 RepID=G5BPH3_HETGA|nr:Centrosomal protein of 72 kDa [Heterocephalus glaber]
MAPAPGSRLVLREETLGERSGLGPHHDLAELQSLSIPGTYQEKITHLGSSLMHFTSLKSLDLSHNSLVSLEVSFRFVPPPASHLAAPLGRRAPLEVVLLEALLHLVDKHWSGCRSLHRNETFLAQARHVLSSVQELAVAQGSVTPGDVEVSCLALENQSLHRQLAEQHQQYTETMDEGTAELSSTQQEMVASKGNQSWMGPLEGPVVFESIGGVLFCQHPYVWALSQSGGWVAELLLGPPGLQTSVKQLSGEVVELKQHLKHYDKIQELTQMLQESHSSLLSTSEHLLQELSRERAQHRAEVEQMRWSFQELKKTTALFPPHSASLGGRQSC